MAVPEKKVFSSNRELGYIAVLRVLVTDVREKVSRYMRHFQSSTLLESFEMQNIDNIWTLFLHGHL